MGSSTHARVAARGVLADGGAVVPPTRLGRTFVDVCSKEAESQQAWMGLSLLGGGSP